MRGMREEMTSQISCNLHFLRNEYLESKTNIKKVNEDLTVDFPIMIYSNEIKIIVVGRYFSAETINTVG